jgi:hypothetical protein
LLAHYETQTKVITVAVDHLYQQEIDDKETTMTTKNKTQVNFRLSPAELKQLAELTRQYGESQRQIIGKAIDRMWMTEIHGKRTTAIDRMWCQEMAEDAGEVVIAYDDGRTETYPDSSPKETTMDELIDNLNHFARNYVSDTRTPVQKLGIAAEFFGLELVAEEGNTRIYRTTRGQLVNCWIAAEGNMSDRLEDGGLGFDDQTEWYTDR